MTQPDPTLDAMNAALEREDFERAFGVLEAAYARGNAVAKTRSALWSAHLHSLYGEAGADDGLNALRLAQQNDFLVTQNPLYASLEAELNAYSLEAGLPPEARGPEAFELERTLRHQATSVLMGAPAAPTPTLTPLARYHALAALTLLDGLGFPDSSGTSAEDVLGLWLSLDWSSLPRHVQWRYFAWLAGVQEGLGQLEGAEASYAQAVQQAPAVQQAAMLSEQAALNLSLERFERASALLERAREHMVLTPPDPQSQVQWHYLKAQAELGLGRSESAHTQILEARRLETEVGEASYGVALIHGQVLMALGRTQEAVAALEAAVTLAAPPDLPYALHELGVAYLDTDRTLEAKDTLTRVLSSEEYPFQPEVYADLAESEYRMGNLHEAEEIAQQALGLGAIVTASLVLGAVALEYYHLDDALEHYSRALQESAEGSREATIAHQMLADILAQQGFSEPARILEHTQKALEHTPPADEWYYTLQGYSERASQLLAAGRSSRTLN